MVQPTESQTVWLLTVKVHSIIDPSAYDVIAQSIFSTYECALNAANDWRNSDYDGVRGLYSTNLEAKPLLS